jgi:hypothetical protein
MSDKFFDIMNKALFPYTDDSQDMIINKKLSEILYGMLLEINFIPTDVNHMFRSIIGSYKEFLLKIKTDYSLDFESDIGKFFIAIGYSISKSDFIIVTCNCLIRIIPYTFIKNIYICNKFILYDIEIQNSRNSLKYVAVYYCSIIRYYLYGEINRSNILLREIAATLDAGILNAFKYIDSHYMDKEARDLDTNKDGYSEILCYALIQFYHKCVICDDDKDLSKLGPFANIIAPILYLRKINKQEKIIKIYI